MGNYYYLVAQLPAIVISRDSTVKPPITYEYFLDLCTRFLEGGVLEQIKVLSLEPNRYLVETDSQFLNRWYEWEKDLRLSLAYFRAAKLKKTFADSELVCVTQDIQQLARTACGFDSPLEAEYFLYNERLKKIDELTPTDLFCADAIFAYGLKLQMTGRIQKFDEDAGMSSYRIIYDQILGESK